MKKYLLFTLAFCLSIISQDLMAQQSVTVTAFRDLNANGADDDASVVPGLTNTTLTISDGITQYDPVETAAGVYTFDNAGAGLPDGTYTLQYIETPWTPASIIVGNEVFAITQIGIDNDVDPVTGISAPFSLSGGAMEMDIDLGLYFVAAIGDLVWEDINGDGFQDGELANGIAGVTVTLLDGTGAPAVDTDGLLVPATTTGGAGDYLFGNIAPASYIVQFSLPTSMPDWFATTFNATEFNNDSDADPDNSFQSTVYTFGPDIIYNSLKDAGFFVAAKIGNMVFCDENGNGVDDDGAAGIERMDVRLIDVNTGGIAMDAEGNAQPTLSTDALGMYEFEKVKPGDYRVEFLFTAEIPMAQFSFTQKDEGGDEELDSDVEDDGASPNFGRTDVFTVVSQDTEEQTKWDCGVYQLITIEGIVWLEDDGNNVFDGEPGPGGILVELVNAVDDKVFGDGTTAAGVYIINDVPPGNYYIQINTAGTSIEGATGCGDSVPVDPPNDNDNNGNDDPIVITTTFELMSNCDVNNPPIVNHIDFCYFFECGDQNSNAKPLCDQIEEIDIICDIAVLGTFCNTMPTGGGAAGQPNPLCAGGGVANNMSWFAFVAYEGAYQVVVTPLPGSCSGSTTGDEGVQIGLYTDCTFTESVFCDPNCSLNPVSFDSADLISGQTYYFFIDGCAGSVCSYQVDITGDPLEPTILPTGVCIDNAGSIVCNDDLVLCPDSDVIFQAQGLDLTVDYTWGITVVAGSGGNYTGAANPMTTEENLPVSFENAGEYRVCLQEVNNGCQFWGGPEICRIIKIEATPDELFDMQTVCDIVDFDPGTLMDMDATIPTDPNEDGIVGWENAAQTFDFGTNTNMVDIDGCMFEQTVEIAQHPASDKGSFAMIICDDELPLSAPGLPEITLSSFVGEPIFTLSDFTLDGVFDKNGCDSIIDATVERLTIFGGIIDIGDCLPEGIIISFNETDFDQTFSSPTDLWTFEWFDPAGDLLPDAFQPINLFDNIAPTASGSGEYKLTITVTKDGVSCPFDYFITVDFEDQKPPEPAIDGMINICESAGPQTYTATGFGDAIDFVWVIPTDAIIVSGGGLVDESVEIDWTGSTGGTISLEIMNLCAGNSNTIDVAIIPLLTPTFTATAEVCEEGSATIMFSGDQTNVDSYTWDFDGGTVQNATGGNGPGPHEISWPDGGTTKTVTLSVVHDGGCISTEVPVLVTVIEPILIIAPTCSSSLGQIIFTWDVLPGTVAGDYTVDVTTGQSGALAGNTFTLLGLGTLEQVDIKLTLMTGDACLTSEVNASCIAQNCTPPIVTVSAPAGVVEFCLNGSDQSFNIEANIPMGVTGTGEYSGTGITDMTLGTFNPDDAGEGTHTINYSYLTNDGCTAAAQVTFTINESPTAMFSTVDTICILDEFVITYEGTTGINSSTYTTDDSQSFTTSEPTITFATAGTHTISLSIMKDGCPSLMPFTKTVFVEEQLAPIVINCVTQEIDNIAFGWNVIDGATGYIVTVTGPDGISNPPFTTTDPSYAEAGLNPNDSITISVTVISGNRCPGSTSSQECFAKACPSVTVSINSIDDQCIDGTNAPIDLVAILAGDGEGTGDFVWSGNGVTGSQFDPNGLAEGPNTINVEYIENGCGGYSNSITVNITQTPTASFDMATDNVCIGSTVMIDYTGSDLPGQIIDWSGSDANVTVTATADPNIYEAEFNAVGTFNVVLDVVNGACSTPTDMSTITVEPMLTFGEIDCNPQESTITFSWAVVDCASEYEVFVNNVSQGIQTTTSFLVEGLGSADEVQLEVIAVSGCACGNVMNTRTCQTIECVQVDLSLSVMGGVTDFCMAADLAAIELMAETVNETGDGVGTWTGTGVDANGIFDPMVAGVGTHTVTYTFIEPNGCENEFTEELTFNIFANPEVVAMAEPITCYDDDMTVLTVNPTNGNGDLAVTLNGDVFDPSAEVSAGSYSILVTDEQGCTAETSIDISIPNEPMPEITGATELIAGETSDYSIEQSLFTGQLIDSIVWTANGIIVCNDATCFSLTNEAPTENTTYEVTVFYNDGCSVTTLIEVEVMEPDPIFTVDIPNIISPNNDGDNDEWQIFTGDPEVVVNSVQIQDRWGNLVFDIPTSFKPSETTITWDGRFGTTELQPGVYVYMVNYIQDGRERVRNGDITIIK